MGFFVSEKILSASFDPRAGFGLGTEWSGEIVEIRPEQQQMKFRTDAEKLRGVPEQPDFWSNGEPKKHLPMVIRAEQVAHLVGQDRPDGTVEDGLRVIFWDSRKKKALREELKAKRRMTDPEPGDWVSLKWVSGVGETGDPKNYVAGWAPGQPSQGVFTDGQPNGAQPPAQPQQQAPQQQYVQPQQYQRPAQPAQQQANPVTGSWGQQTAAAPADAPF
jgi:hypothetical protein